MMFKLSVCVSIVCVIVFPLCTQAREKERASWGSPVKTRTGNSNLCEPPNVGVGAELSNTPRTACAFTYQPSLQPTFIIISRV